MKTTTRLTPLLAAVTVLGLIGYVGFTNVSRRDPNVGHRQIQFYQDSMHPWVKSDRPGKCTICGMDLTAIYTGEKEFGNGNNLVVLSPSGITVVNVQAETVQRRLLDRTMRVAGTLEADETHKVVVAAPARGRVDALTVKYAGMEVAKGQRLVTLYSPELQQQNRFLFASRLLNQGGATNATDHNPYAKFDAASGAYVYSGDLLAPQAGVVVERNVYEGQFVTEGDKLMTIVDAGVLWFRFDVYEQQLPWFQIGQTIAVTVPAVPGKKFPAVISFIEATLDEATRTVKVRADIKNPPVEANGQPQRWLRFGMYAEGRVQVEAKDVVAVPRTAVLFPDGTAYAYVEKDQGTFERRRLELGRQGDAFWEVLSGLEAGERVVTSGNVLIDAQAQFNQDAHPILAGPEQANPETAPRADAADTTMPSATTGNRVVDAQPLADAVQSSQVARYSLGTIKPNANEQKVAETVLLFAAPTIPPLAETESAARPALAAGDLASGPGSQFSELPVPDPVLNRVSPRRNSSLLRAAYRDQQQALRSALIAEAHRQPAAGAIPPAADSVRVFPAVFRTGADLSPANESLPEPTLRIRTIAMQTAVPEELSAPQVIPPSTNRFSTHREADVVRRGVSASMRQMRMETISKAQGTTNANQNISNLEQNAALGAFIAVANSVSTALAADNLAKLNQGITNLPAALAGLQSQPGTNQHRSMLIQNLAAASKWQPAADLADARKQFLPFSTAVVVLTAELRRTEPLFAGLKIYHCPMAPKPGLWMQINGPLRNPFYGAKMLTCGEEVRPKVEAVADSTRTPQDPAVPAR